MAGLTKYYYVFPVRQYLTVMVTASTMLVCAMKGMLGLKVLVNQ
jgi:hypothetical protein